MEEKKKKNTGLIILVVVLLIACAIMGAFIFMNKEKLFAKENTVTTVGNDKKNTNDGKCKDVKVYSVMDDEISELINNLLVGFECSSLEKYTNNKKVSVDDIDAYAAYQIGMYNHDSNSTPSKETLSLDDVNKRIQKYLGKDYKFDPEKLPNTKGDCISHYYDSSSKTFPYQETACGGTCGPHTTYELVKAVDTDGVLELEVKVLFVNKDLTAFYSDYNKTLKVSDIHDINEYLEFKKGSTYKFTFKNEDGNYVFVSSEPVK